MAHCEKGNNACVLKEKNSCRHMKEKLSLVLAAIGTKLSNPHQTHPELQCPNNNANDYQQITYTAPKKRTRGERSKPPQKKHKTQTTVYTLSSTQESHAQPCLSNLSTQPYVCHCKAQRCSWLSVRATGNDSDAGDACTSNGRNQRTKHLG